MQTSLYFFFPCGWKHRLGNTLSRWREAKKHRKSSRAADVQPRGDAGREGDEDDQMAAAAETGGEFGGHVLFNAPPVGKETPTGGGGFLGNCGGVCAGKQMLPTIAAVEESSGSTATAFTAP